MFARTAFFAVTAAALALTGPAALAGQIETGASVPVRFGDLDLTTEKGVTTLKRRINSAVAKTCGRADIRDLRQSAVIDACRDFAMSKANPEVELAVAAARKGERYASATPITIHTR